MHNTLYTEVSESALRLSGTKQVINRREEQRFRTNERGEQ